MITKEFSAGLKLNLTPVFRVAIGIDGGAAREDVQVVSFSPSTVIWWYGNRKQEVDFHVPEDLATEFLRRTPPNNRSRYVAAAVAAKLREREDQLVRACEVANNSADVLNIENSFDRLADEVDHLQERW